MLFRSAPFSDNVTFDLNEQTSTITAGKNEAGNISSSSILKNDTQSYVEFSHLPSAEALEDDYDPNWKIHMTFSIRYMAMLLSFSSVCKHVNLQFTQDLPLQVLYVLPTHDEQTNAKKKKVEEGGIVVDETGIDYSERGENSLVLFLAGMMDDE
mgnify:CR=1 FL=1